MLHKKAGPIKIFHLIFLISQSSSQHQLAYYKYINERKSSGAVVQRCPVKKVSLEILQNLQ